VRQVGKIAKRLGKKIEIWCAAYRAWRLVLSSFFQYATDQVIADETKHTTYEVNLRLKIARVYSRY